MKKITDRYMELAIKEAAKNLKRMDGGPFGACIVKGNRVLALARNTVLKTNDPTCHAEVNAIRIASRRLKNFDLSGSTIYSTTEPCPMCFSAIHWARIERIVYGSRVQDAKIAGFNELLIPDVKLKKISGSKVRLIKSCLSEICTDLFRQWDALPNKKVY